MSSTSQHHHHPHRSPTRFTASAPRKVSDCWSSPRPSMPFLLVSTASMASTTAVAPGSDLWTIQPGRRDLWSYLTYAMSNGKTKSLKIFILETTMEKKKRFVGPTFRSPQEAKKNCTDNPYAWPDDREPLTLDQVRSEGLLRAWSKVWSPDLVEQCMRTSAECAEKFVETFNVLDDGGLLVKVPKAFTDQLLLQIHREPDAINPIKYGRMGGYFFPDRPNTSINEEDEDNRASNQQLDKESEKEKDPTAKAPDPEKKEPKLPGSSEKKKRGKWKFKSLRDRSKDRMFKNANKTIVKQASLQVDEPQPAVAAAQCTQVAELASKITRFRCKSIEHESVEIDESNKDKDKNENQSDLHYHHHSKETPVHRRVYAFATITVNTEHHKTVKYAYVRSRIRGDHYFVAVTPDFADDQLEELKDFFERDESPFPQFDFDAKWMLQELDESPTGGNRAGAGRAQSLF